MRVTSAPIEIALLLVGLLLFTFGLAFSICILIAVPIERLCTAFD